MNDRNLYGVVCASICPMHEDGSVDYEGVRRLTAHLVESGVHSLYPNGTNGESLSLTAEERFRVAEAVRGENAGRAVLYIQCGAATVEATYEQALFCSRLGVDGVGIMTPVFFAADDQALFEYYDEILPRIPGTPVYAYNIPTRSGNDLSAGVLGALMEKHPNLRGIKYSYPDILRIQRYVECCQRRASTLIGCDALAAACYMAGGDGWVSGPAAVFPRRHVRLYEALRSGDAEAVARCQSGIRRTADAMADIPEIPAIKYMLKRMGIIGSEACRRPLRRLTDAEKGRLDAILETYLAEG